MSEHGKSPLGGHVSDGMLGCLEDRHRSRPGTKDATHQENVPEASEPIDPHVAWLKEWRHLRTQIDHERSPRDSSAASNKRLRWLQDQIAHTPAATRSGLLAQAELICDLAWNDVVAATARHLVAGLKRMV
ncbi:MAG: hypothetical protein ACR2Q4_13995 [Geminicoccaceae bacterium]